MRRRVSRYAALAAASFVVVAAGAGVVRAHPLAPSSLRVVEADDGSVEVRLRTPETRPSGSELVPVFPRACTEVAPPRITRAGDAIDEVTRLACERGIVGARFAFRGLLDAGTDVVWTVQLRDGTTARGLLHGDDDTFVVPAKPSPFDVFADYVRLGMEHLVTGLDHVLFVLSLLFVLDRKRALVVAVTAFTVGHSASLALAALDVVTLPSAPVEVAIAATLLFMAFEILRRERGGEGDERFQRRPAAVSGLFGLVHGLGFAGVLTDAGLPAGAVPEALLGFNLGIEVAQLALVALALAVGAALGRLPLLRRARPRLVAAYATGSLAAMWILERGLILAA